MINYVEHDVPGGSPVKMWTKNVRIEDEAIAQMKNVAMLPIIHKHVAKFFICAIASSSMRTFLVHIFTGD
ncbi:MAG: hypothetical protein AAFR75_07620, partial [Pseudomonadota bacterium]